MSESNLLFVARIIGIVGVGLLVTSGIGGVLMASRMAQKWRGMQGKLFFWHRIVSLVGASCFLFHPIPMLFSPKTTGGLTIEHIVIPFDAPKQTLFIGLGTVATYLLVIVTVTSLNIKRVGRDRWRLLHYLTYGVLFLGLAHGLFISGEFKTGELFEPDEPEKIILMILSGIAIAFPIWRMWISRINREKKAAV